MNERGNQAYLQDRSVSDSSDLLISQVSFRKLDADLVPNSLLRDGRIELACGMVDSFFFEIDHHGAVLNANRAFFFDALSTSVS